MLNIKEIKELIEVIDKSTVVEIEIEKKDEKIRIVKQQTSVGTTTFIQPMEMAAINEKKSTTVINTNDTDKKLSEKSDLELEVLTAESIQIKSPMVGTFYAAPSPDMDAYIKVGDTVLENDVVCIIEAMKLMNEIEAEVSGKVIEVCVVNGQLVEYGQILFKLAKE